MTLKQWGWGWELGGVRSSRVEEEGDNFTVSSHDSTTADSTTMDHVLLQYLF